MDHVNISFALGHQTAIYVAELLDSFLVQFQSSDPLIHRLYESIGRLMFDIMANFVKKKRLMERGSDRRLEANSWDY